MGLKIQDPVCNKSAKYGCIGDYNGHVIFDMVDTKVDWICPVRLEETVDTVALREIYLGRANGRDPRILSAGWMRQTLSGLAR